MSIFGKIKDTVFGKKAEAQDTKDQQGSAGDAIASTNPISQTVRIDLAIQQENRNVEINTYIEEAFLEDLAALAEAEAEQNQQEIDELYEEIQEEIEEEVEGIDEPYDVFLLPGFEQFNNLPATDQGMLAAAIWFDLINANDPFYEGEGDVPGQDRVPLAFLSSLSSNQGLNYTGGLEPILAAMDAYREYGHTIEDENDDSYMPGPDDLRVVLAIVDEFCRATFPGDGGGARGARPRPTPSASAFSKKRSKAATATALVAFFFSSVAFSRSNGIMGCVATCVGWNRACASRGSPTRS